MVKTATYQIRPLTFDLAAAFVVKHHRHHKEPQGFKFCVGLYEDDELVGCAIVGRVNAIKLDDGYTAEVTRLCVLENKPNGCSQLYGACSRIAREFGFHKIVTFILMSEPGTSLKASGWQLEAENIGTKGKWNDSKQVTRSKPQQNLFGEESKYPNEKKQRWVKILKQQVKQKEVAI